MVVQIYFKIFNFFEVNFIPRFNNDSLYFGFYVSFPLHVTLYHHKKLIKSVIRVFTWRTNYFEDCNNSKDDDNDDGDNDDDEKDNDDNDDDDAEVESVNIKGQTG